MTKLSELTVTVTPQLTIDDDTAQVCLGLLELYCRHNDKTIDVQYRIGECREVVLNIVNAKQVEYTAIKKTDYQSYASEVSKND